ncbi:MAG: response regulator [Anaerolineae bacterium]
MAESAESASRDLQRATDELHDLLAHLYDYEYLREHELLAWLPLGLSTGSEGRMGALRATVLEALEELGPPERGRFRASCSRSYSVINLHYVEGLTVQEVALELAVSERQAYRDLKKAERDLAALLLERASGRASQGGQSRVELLDREVERASEGASHVTVSQLLQGACRAVAKLAAERGIALKVSAEEGAIQTQRVLVRQALLTVVSHALESPCQGSSLKIEGQVAADQLVLTVRFLRCQEGEPTREPAETYRLPQTAEHLIARLGGSWQASETGEGYLTVTLRLGQATSASVLVIDDHQGLAELFRRYLWGEPYDVYEATSGESGVVLVETLHPDLVVLDVMMPDQDGWEVLQRLQSRPATRDIPVIICSVLDQPSLAFSLGAVDYIAKPVMRDQLVQVVQRHRWDSSLGSRRAAPAGRTAPPKGAGPDDAPA